MEINAMDNEQDNQWEDSTPEDPDWENRVLCSDGNCIGVIGSDGRCKECGKPYEGTLPESSSEEGASSETVEEQRDGAPDVSEADPRLPADRRENDDWENRVLCSDGNCIGVIGPDGRCKECGKPQGG
jgi:hypothetical protein